MLRGHFLDDPESKFGRLKFNSCCFRYETQLGSELGQLSAPTCFIVAAEKFITGYHSRHETSSEYEHIIFKKNNLVKVNTVRS